MRKREREKARERKRERKKEREKERKRERDSAALKRVSPEQIAATEGGGEREKNNTNK